MDPAGHPVMGGPFTVAGVVLLKHLAEEEALFGGRGVIRELLLRFLQLRVVYLEKRQVHLCSPVSYTSTFKCAFK